jgi:Holliday junction resolvase RusA-like endonuclease
VNEWDEQTVRTWLATLYGEPVSKANSRRVVRTRRGQRAVIKSAKALIWSRYVAQQLQVMPRQPMLQGRVLFCATLYYCSERPDLDESLLLDLLQGHAYKNDRQVRSKHIIHRIDKQNPRAEVFVREIP